ncbi:MAG TPA: hypothetical protein VFK56_20955, partial [Mycobacterium sp.]|nr:hypothetical protein [Mycobacterium sp.]
MAMLPSVWPGIVQDLCTVAEVEDIAIDEGPIDRHRRRRVRQSNRNTLIDRHFPILEHWRGHRRTCAYRR